MRPDRKRINLYMDADLIDAIKYTAKKQRRSMANYISVIMAEHVEQYSPGSGGDQPGAKGRSK